MRIVSIYPNFSNKGGAQNVTLQLAHCLTNEARPLVLTRTPPALVAADYQAQATFRRLTVRSVLSFRLKDTLFISHDRKSTSFLLLLKRTFLPQLRVLHVAHSVYDTLKWATLLPHHNIVAVSKAVSNNLQNYFGVDSSHITVIYNGIRDEGFKPDRFEASKVINILLAAQIYPLKQQVAIARFLKGKMPPHVHLFFAGDGVDSKTLKAVIEDDSQLHYLGQIDVKANIDRFHYTLLFSQREGLPITLIESCMYGLPMITNQLPAVLEVNNDGQTGFAYANFNALLEGLKKLPFANSAEYKRLSVNARQRYETLFTERHMIDEYKHVISQIK